MDGSTWKQVVLTLLGAGIALGVFFTVGGGLSAAAWAAVVIVTAAGLTQAARRSHRQACVRGR